MDGDALVRGRVDANGLARFYTRFRVGERLLLTGHSHQAWPDVAFDGHQEAWHDAALLVDDKWDRAFAKAERVRQGFRTILADADGDYALGASTHELVVRFLSALPLRQRPTILTTDAEYHSLRRQLDRLGEEGVVIERVAAGPVDTLAERLAGRVTDRTAAVCVSAVLFRDARIVPHLGHVAAAARRHGVRLLVDAYHALNAIPFTIANNDLHDAFVVGGGYKYCQLGEGNCFLRIPPGCTDRPVVTGWFSEFSALTTAADQAVAYGDGPARYAGSTYDPTSHYRAARVFDFFAEQGLSPARLRATSQHQMGRMAARFEAAALDPTVIRRPNVPLDNLAAFLALQCRDAATLHAALKERGVLTDYRGDLLRLGPAPYLTDAQLDQAVDLVVETARL
jgi:kynureninase